LSREQTRITESPDQETDHKTDDSFERLVLEHHRSIRIFIARYVHCREQVEDLAQEVFIAGFRQMKQFRHDSKISTWLLGIARNKALHFLRTEMRRRRKRKAFAEAEAYRLSLECLNRESNIEIHEARLGALQDCIDQLPNRSKRLVGQFYFDNQTAVKIAQQSCQKESAIRMKLKRIRGVLQSCIDFKLSDQEKSQR